MSKQTDIYLSTENNLRPLDGDVVSLDTWEVRRGRMGRLSLYLAVAIIVGTAIWSLVV